MCGQFSVCFRLTWSSRERGLDYVNPILLSSEQPAKKENSEQFCDMIMRDDISHTTCMSTRSTRLNYAIKGSVRRISSSSAAFVCSVHCRTADKAWGNKNTLVCRDEAMGRGHACIMCSSNHASAPHIRYNGVQCASQCNNSELVSGNRVSYGQLTTHHRTKHSSKQHST